MLQSTSSFQPFTSLKRGSRGRASVSQENNGWASEDVTDVQEMGDFDFEEALAKFDKRTLFDQMRKDDRVDEADRLVSHNRQPRNLHYSENVLDMPPAAVSRDVARDFWNSEADDGGERLSGREPGSRQSSRRGESKVSSSRRSQSRKASATAQGPIRVNSGVSTQHFEGNPELSINREPSSSCQGPHRCRDSGFCLPTVVLRLYPLFRCLTSRTLHIMSWVSRRI